MLRLRRRIILSNPKALFITIFILAVGTVLTDRFAPPQHLPWKPLDLDAPIGVATGTKITLMAMTPGDGCLKKLSAAKALRYELADTKKDGKTCGYSGAAVMKGAHEARFRPADVTAQCPVVAASYIWLNDLDDKAKARFGSGLKTVFHAGTYSCRRQVGNSSGAWSEHAFANAWDITGFELNDGTVISVFKDWTRPDRSKAAKQKAAFLRDARDTACRLFRIVLSPDYNAAHKDHFHFDQGPSLSCR